MWAPSSALSQGDPPPNWLLLLRSSFFPPHVVSTSLPSDTHIFPLFDLQLVAPPLICAPLLILGAVQRGVGGRYGEFGGGWCYITQMTLMQLFHPGNDLHRWEPLRSTLQQERLVIWSFWSKVWVVGLVYGGYWQEWDLVEGVLGYGIEGELCWGTALPVYHVSCQSSPP